MRDRQRSSQFGQVLPLFALALAAIVLGVAVVVDGGYGFSKRRAVQNAADFAALAGSRIVGIWMLGEYPGVGTATNVEGAVQSALASNDAELIRALYVSEDGSDLGDVVGASEIPEGTRGVVVDAKVGWRPFLLGLIGVTDWEASSIATAKSPDEEIGDGILPVGISESAYQGLDTCDPVDFANCDGATRLSEGSLNAPGNFGWLSFGLQGNGGKCAWDHSLGMSSDSDGCQASKDFLDRQIGPPANAHGLHEPVYGVHHGIDNGYGDPDSVDLIAGLPGNEWGDLSYYIEHEIMVWVPIFADPESDAGATSGNGRNAAYNIVGYGTVVFTGDNLHAKWLEARRVTGQCWIELDDDPFNELTDWTTEKEGHDYCIGPVDAYQMGITSKEDLVR